MRTICFLKSRRGVELIQRFTRQRLEDEGRSDLAERIAPYRAGYTPAQRREIERRLSEGDLLAVVATDALELGIDIGDLDAAICVTFPGTVATPAPDVGPRRPPQHRASPCTWRARTRSTSSSAATPTSSSSGRWSGRSSTTSPSRSTRRTWPPRRTSCRSRPRTPRSSGRAGRSTRGGSSSRARCASAAGATCRAGPATRPRGSRCARRRPTRCRSSRPGGGEVIGNVEAARALSAVHPGAVYLHMGAAYEVEELDLGAAPRASVRPFDGDWYTQPKKESETWIEQVRDQRDALRRDAVVRRRVGDRAGGGLPEEARDGPLRARPARARPARAGLRDPGALVRAARLARCARSSRSRCSRARCTPPSTARSRCCR